MATATNSKTDFTILQSKLPEERYSQKDVLLIKDAYDVAQDAHEGQILLTGDPYFNHAFATAMKLADMMLPAEVIAAGILHDVPEDTDVKIEKLRELFGDDIAGMVRSTTKLGHVQYRGLERYVENLRKMFIAMAKDVRVIFIKFADRMHNAQNLQMQN